MLTSDCYFLGKASQSIKPALSTFFLFRKDESFKKISVMVILMKEVIYKLPMPLYRSIVVLNFELSRFIFFSLLLI